VGSLPSVNEIGKIFLDLSSCDVMSSYLYSFDCQLFQILRFKASNVKLGGTAFFGGGGEKKLTIIRSRN
jgi:hypothetical protein